MRVFPIIHFVISPKGVMIRRKGRKKPDSIDIQFNLSVIHESAVDRVREDIMKGRGRVGEEDDVAGCRD